MKDCSYDVRATIETKNGVSSLIRCAKACFKKKECNIFTFAESTCTLKNISSWELFGYTKKSICGLIPNRMPKPSICQWQTSEDGSYQWADNCYARYYGGLRAPQVARTINPCNSTRTCAKACLANPNCHLFYYRNQGNYYDCLLHKAPNPTSVLYQTPWVNGDTAGFIVTRKFNIDFIQNYCVNYN